MKTLQLALVFTVLIVIVPHAYGVESPGLKKIITIETGGYQFDVDVVSTFQLNQIDFSKDDKKITFYITNGITNNLAEIQIPINLINGDLTFFLDGQEIFPQVRQNDQISFVILEFEGEGEHTLEVIGTTYLPEFSEIAPLVLASGLIGLVLIRKIHKI